MPIFYGKGGIRNCSCYRVVKMKTGMMVGMVLENRFHRLMNDNEV